MTQLSSFRTFFLVVFAEIQRTYQEKVSYKTQMILGMLTGLVSLAQFAILGYYVSLGGTPPGLGQYGDDIIAFMIIGSLFTAVAVMMMNSLKMQIQSEQQRGTLEAIALSKAGLFRFLLSGSVIGITTSLFFSALIFGVFALMFDFPLNVNFVGLGFAIGAAVICMWLVGLCAASYILISKQGEPITWTVTTVLALFSGVMFPITIFPAVIVNALNYLPTAGMLHALRISLLAGASTTDIMLALLPTLITIILLLPTGIYMWNRSLKKVRLSGTLGGY